MSRDIGKRPTVERGPNAPVRFECGDSDIVGPFELRSGLQWCLIGAIAGANFEVSATAPMILRSAVVGPVPRGLLPIPFKGQRDPKRARLQANRQQLNANEETVEGVGNDLGNS